MRTRHSNTFRASKNLARKLLTVRGAVHAVLSHHPARLKCWTMKAQRRRSNLGVVWCGRSWVELNFRLLNWCTTLISSKHRLPAAKMKTGSRHEPLQRAMRPQLLSLRATRCPRSSRCPMNLRLTSQIQRCITCSKQSIRSSRSQSRFTMFRPSWVMKKRTKCLLSQEAKTKLLPLLPQGLKCLHHRSLTRKKCGISRTNSRLLASNLA